MNNFILRIFALLGLIILSPILLVSMFFILIEDGFPLLFIQDRLGKSERVFKIYKLRTMKKDTPNKGTHEISELNYLKCGNYLRKYKIDELPQVINYLKGDINLIGPRPGLPSQTKLRESRLKQGIFSISPGITGLSQVLGYDMSDPDLLSRIDRIYLNNKNFKVDIYIFLATFTKIFKRKLSNIYKEEIK
tara:strand:- start:812 stop:1384 length:573 start_codon:yes stop_codon:yes gene_type:complete